MPTTIPPRAGDAVKSTGAADNSAPAHASVAALFDDLYDRLERAQKLLRAIRPWAEHPDAGEPGNRIKRLLDDHERITWVTVDPVDEFCAANVGGVTR